MSLTDLGLIRPCYSVTSCEALADLLSRSVSSVRGVCFQETKHAKDQEKIWQLTVTSQQPGNWQSFPSSVQWLHQTWGKNPPRTATSSKPYCARSSTHTRSSFQGQ